MGTTIRQLIDSKRLVFTCPHCAAQRSKSIRWLRAHGEVACLSCEYRMPINHDRVEAIARSSFGMIQVTRVQQSEAQRERRLRREAARAAAVPRAV